MSKNHVHSSDADWFKDQIARIQEHLSELDQWPEMAQQLLREIVPNLPSQELSQLKKDDFAMLEFVIDDALKGVDIIRQYPDFYQKMLVHPDLRDAFLDTLELLEQEEAGKLEPLPLNTAVDLTFLKSAPNTPLIHRLSGSWHIAWSQTSEQLSQLFTPTRFAYRQSHSYMENTAVTLLRSTTSIDGLDIELILEAIQPATQVKQLNLAIEANVLDEHMNEPETYPQLNARVQWGDFDETAVIGPEGYTQLPPLFINSIWDSTTQEITQDLQVTLELVPPE